MGNFHDSGRVRVTCAGCATVNELTAVNLTISEIVTCSRCHAPLGKWDALLARTDEIRPEDPPAEAPAA